MFEEIFNVLIKVLITVHAWLYCYAANWINTIQLIKHKCVHEFNNYEPDEHFSDRRERLTVLSVSLHDNTHNQHSLHPVTLTELRFYVPLDTKQVISETFPKSISWLGMEN